MRLRERALDLISKGMWCVFLSLVVMVPNMFLRFIIVFLGVIILISTIELGRYILMDEAPLYNELIRVRDMKNSKEKLYGALSLVAIPLTTIVILMILLHMLELFFKYVRFV